MIDPKSTVLRRHLFLISDCRSSFWKRHYKPAAASAASATGDNFAAMRFDQFAYYREPDTQADTVQTDGLCVLHEWLEELGSASAVIPIPLSDTVSTIASSTSDTDNSIRPSFGMYLEALSSRLVKTCARRIESPSTSRRHEGIWHRSAVGESPWQVRMHRLLQQSQPPYQPTGVLIATCPY